MIDLAPPKDIIQEMIRQHHIAQDMKLLHDLLVEIMWKGYYPVIMSENKPPTMAETESGFIVTQPLGLELKLKTPQEIKDMGYDFVDYLTRFNDALKVFHGSKPSANKEVA